MHILFTGSRSPTTTECALGYYCTKGTDTEEPCPEGRLLRNPIFITTLFLLLVLKITETIARNDQTDHVLLNIFPFCKNFLAGTYAAGKKLAASEECTKCPAGRKCMGEALTTPGENCTAGYYCPVSSL